jgi:monofunctional biosynthetic peptidoglycan transglycosylase
MAESQTSNRAQAIGSTRPQGRLRRVVFAAAALAIAVPLGLIVLYRFIDPPLSTLMAGRLLTGGSVSQTWVRLEKMSPQLVATVVANEDARICRHWGVDWNAVEEAIDEAEETGKQPRGASTIPMQVAKNLFLWPQRSYVRKAIEIPMAYSLNALWPKRRTVEIYLNIAEWAPGVYGAEAAARHHFGKSSAAITRREAALLAAALPNPYVRHAGRAGPKTRRLARHIERRTAKSPPYFPCIAPR